jgi:predicted Zn-dependent protease
VICFNPLQLWETALDGRRETFSIRRVATHEIGHTIGLDHPGRTGQLMGYMYREDTDRLQSGDAAGAKLLYGPPAP